MIVCQTLKIETYMFHICSTSCQKLKKNTVQVPQWIYISDLQDVYLGLTFCLTDFQHSLHIVFSTISYDYALRQVAVLRFDDSLDC